jgi:hypothetical protein
MRTCADRNGDEVFDTYGPTSCKDKASGLSNNFAAQQWCKDSGSPSGSCWIPYSMKADMSCFPLDKDKSGQWTQLSADGWSAKSSFGGSQVLLPGADIPAADFQNAGSPTLASSKVKSGNIGGVSASAIGAACVIGFFAKKNQKRKANKGSPLTEMQGNAAGSV